MYLKENHAKILNWTEATKQEKEALTIDKNVNNLFYFYAVPARCI